MHNGYLGNDCRMSIYMRFCATEILYPCNKYEEININDVSFCSSMALAIVK